VSHGPDEELVGLNLIVDGVRKPPEKKLLDARGFFLPFPLSFVPVRGRAKLVSRRLVKPDLEAQRP
jgi:hypothetical protein